jgi:glycosyltransferase involved in cell wall biosynthesis
MSLAVSILIPCYNAEQWIRQAIQSALNQTYPQKEVIVVDDGSTDNSLEIIKSFGDSILWETGENRGGNIARNRLLELSSGEWLQYLDADDYLLPNKISKQIQFLEKNPDTDIIYSPSILEHHAQQEIKQEILPIPQPHDPWILLARWYLPQTGSPLWRKQAIIDVGGWKIDQPCCQEHELYLRLLIAEKRFQYYEQADSVYRQWSESSVCKKSKPETYRRRLEVTDKIEQHLAATKQLTQLRQNAINQARFECARIIWLTNPAWAKEIIKQIRNTDSYFIPSGDCAPEMYRIMYKFLGFELAEKLARLKRNLVTN